MNKKTLIIALVIFIIIGVFFIAGYLSQNGLPKNNEKGEEPDSFIKCLVEAGVVIYGSKTCPACFALVESLGGYDKIRSIYVECSEQSGRCRSEMKGNYVPEIQIKGELYNGRTDLDSLAGAAGCELR